MGRDRIWLLNCMMLAKLMYQSLSRLPVLDRQQPFLILIWPNPNPEVALGSNTPPLLLRTRCCQPGPCAGSAGTPEDTTPCHRDQQATGETSQRGAPSRTGRRKRCFQKRPLRRMKPEDSLSVAICSARVFGVKTVKRGCGRGTPGADLQRRRVSLHWNGAESQRERSAVSSR